MHFTRTLQRIIPAFAATAMLSALALGNPSPASAKEKTQVLLESSFNSLTAGPVTTPVELEVGTLEASEGVVAIADAEEGQALLVDGTSSQSTALLQFSSYPGILPAKTKGTVQVRVEADLTMPISGTVPMSSTTGASFGLYSDPNFFEFFSFGADGQLTRDGQPLGLTAEPGSRVELEARIKVGPGRQVVWISIKSDGVKQNFTTTLTSGFTRETINQLRFQGLAGSSPTLLDNLRVRLMPDEPAPARPAVIVIDDSTYQQDIQVINNITFVSVNLTFVNTGGMANGTMLVLNLDDFDDLFDLDDISFLIGTGYVAKIDGKLMYIGLGKNNAFEGKIKIKIKFKAKGDDIKLKASFKLQFDDVDGPRVVVVPVVIAPVVVAPVEPVVEPVVVVAPLTIDDIDDRFDDYWRDNGGLLIFGLPITEPITQSNGLIIQYFERARLEYHLTASGVYVIQLGLLAVELGYTQVPTDTEVPTNTADLVWYFQPTGHIIASPFRNYWRDNGGLAIFGLPISAVILEDGKQVQYFERARLELHPEFAGTAYEVQLGRLGVERAERE